MESIILISILFVKSLSKNLGELELELPYPIKRKCPAHDLPDRTEHFSFEYIDICLINRRCTDLPDRYAYCTK